jgi:hypothetical protein
MIADHAMGMGSALANASFAVTLGRLSRRT